jgi:DNA-binding transcriptional regulator/RsmH inhibitor MraZ
MDSGFNGGRLEFDGYEAPGAALPLDGHLSIEALRALNAANDTHAAALPSSSRAAPFVGHAILPVKRGGNIRLPDFVRRTLVARRSPIFLGLHEADSCLVGFTQSWHERITGELSRRHSEDLRGSIGDDRSYARRVFGFCEQIWHAGGSIRLSDWAMATAGISETALVVGIGETFEIWSPEEAQLSSDKTLVALAHSAIKFRT